jgi:hypothetical protein
MEFKEFDNYKKENDSRFIGSTKYTIDKEHDFYLEPNFESQLNYLSERFRDRYSEIIGSMMKLVQKNKHVIFTADFENPVVILDGYVYKEVEDILNPLNIDSGYISRGSDYGD